MCTTNRPFWERNDRTHLHNLPRQLAAHERVTLPHKFLIPSQDTSLLDANMPPSPTDPNAEAVQRAGACPHVVRSFRIQECGMRVPGFTGLPELPGFRTHPCRAVERIQSRPKSGLDLSHFSGKSLSRLSNCSLLAGQREYPSSLSLFLSRSISLSLSRVHHFYFETSPLSTACLGEQRSAKREDLCRTYDVGP